MKKMLANVGNVLSAGPTLSQFRLYISDAKKQSQMAAYMKERDMLKSTIITYDSLFETNQQLINELKSKMPV